MGWSIRLVFIKGNTGRVLPYCQTLLCKNKDEHYSTLSKLKKHEGFYHESDLYLWVSMFFMSGNKIASTDKLTLVEEKGGYI